MKYKKIEKCLCCEGENLEKVLDLGEQPLANSYVQSKNSSELTFPLALNYCKDCTHLQLTHAVNPDLLFKHYLYVSGTTKTLKNYFEKFVYIVYEVFEKRRLSMKVLDIACNDGSQLDAFKNQGHETYGIDPAQNLYELSSKNHKVVCDYLNENSIKKLGCKKFDVIIAQNVFAHNIYPSKFLGICKEYLHDDGRIFIQTSQAEMVSYGQFDTVYHEHISFFNANSMRALVDRSGLYLVDVRKTDIHGTSYIFILAKTNKGFVVDEEKQTLDVVKKFSENAKLSISELNEKLYQFKKTHKLIGYGAAAKGNTVLNFGQIYLDMIVDDNPMKQGLFTPGMKIPIVSLENAIRLSENLPIVWIPLSWNFFKEIKSNIQKIRNDDRDRFIQLNFAKI